MSNLKQTIKAYKKRMGMRHKCAQSSLDDDLPQRGCAMFKDCKSGGYNLEQCPGNEKRLLSLILLIAIAYTCAVRKGQALAFLEDV